MAAGVFTLTTNSSSDFLYRQWINEIHNMFITTGGLIRTNDNNQLNLSTLIRTANIESVAMIPICYRFNDPLQDTYPIFINAYFGRRDTGDGPIIMLAIGTGTDGNGNLINSVSTPNMRGFGQLNRFRISANNGQFTLAWCYESTIQGLVSIERNKDVTGSNTEGITVLSAVSPSAHVRNVYHYSYITNTWVSTAPGVMPPPSGSTGVYGNQCGVYSGFLD